MPIENNDSRLNIHTDRTIFGFTAKSSDIKIRLQKDESKVGKPIENGFDRGYLSIASSGGSNIDIEVFPNINSRFNSIQYYLIRAFSLVAKTKINSLNKKSETLTIPHFIGCTQIVVTLE